MRSRPWSASSAIGANGLEVVAFVGHAFIAKDDAGRTWEPAARPAPTSSAAADRSDHVHARAFLECRVELGPPAVDVDVDVRAQHRAALADPVAESRPALVEAVERLVDGRRVHVELPRELREERKQRRWDMQLCHGYPHQASMVATSTEAIAGR